jgi:hypothetical protein
MYCDQLADAIVRSEAARLDHQGSLSRILRPQMARGAGLDADVVGFARHDACERTRQVGKAAFAHVAIADEVVDGAAKKVPRWMREEARKAHFGS